MNDRDADRAEAIPKSPPSSPPHTCGFASQNRLPPMVDCPETKSESCDGWLTT